MFLSCLACQHFIAQLLIGHLPRKLNNGKGILFSVEQVFVGRDEKQARLKTPAWEAKPNTDSTKLNTVCSI